MAEPSYCKSVSPRLKIVELVIIGLCFASDIVIIATIFLLIIPHAYRIEDGLRDIEQAVTNLPQATYTVRPERDN